MASANDRLAVYGPGTKAGFDWRFVDMLANSAVVLLGFDSFFSCQ